MKKLLAIVLVAAMSLSLVACGPKADGKDDVKPGKVAIITGTVSQGEEEFQAAEQMKAKYPDRVVTATYPDNFDKEQETTISNVVSLVSDPDVKALVFVQAVPGASAAIAKAREVNPDLVVIAGTAGEDPGVICAAADVVLGTDEIGMGKAIPEQAKALGAKTFVHYSFARHLAYATISARLSIMKTECEKIGLELVEATAPDPLSEVGLAGAQMFMMEDVPKMIERYGKDTAFFCTNCGLQEPLIKQVVAGGALYPQPCCPSPYHAFPGALGVEIPKEKAGDVDFAVEQIKAKVAELGMTGRMSTWPSPVNMSMVIGATEYLLGWVDAGCDMENKVDMDKLSAALKEAAKTDVTFSALVLDGTTYDNYLQMLCGYITF
ncbi:MAG: DUF3798 domain-containing protein [Oscillospiraceae bacterium]